MKYSSKDLARLTFILVVLSRTSVSTAESGPAAETEELNRNLNAKPSKKDLVKRSSDISLLEQGEKLNSYNDIGLADDVDKRSRSPFRFFGTLGKRDDSLNDLSGDFNKRYLVSFYPTLGKREDDDNNLENLNFAEEINPGNIEKRRYKFKFFGTLGKRSHVQFPDIQDDMDKRRHPFGIPMLGKREDKDLGSQEFEKRRMYLMPTLGKREVFKTGSDDSEKEAMEKRMRYMVPMLGKRNWDMIRKRLRYWVPTLGKRDNGGVYGNIEKRYMKYFGNLGKRERYNSPNLHHFFTGGLGKRLYNLDDLSYSDLSKRLNKGVFGVLGKRFGADETEQVDNDTTDENGEKNPFVVQLGKRSVETHALTNANNNDGHSRKKRSAPYDSLLSSAFRNYDRPRRRIRNIVLRRLIRGAPGLRLAPSLGKQRSA